MNQDLARYRDCQERYQRDENGRLVRYGLCCCGQCEEYRAQTQALITDLLSGE